LEKHFCGSQKFFSFILNPSKYKYAKYFTHLNVPQKNGGNLNYKNNQQTNVIAYWDIKINLFSG